MAELADALDLGSSGRPCRFDSCHPQQETRVLKKSKVASLLFNCRKPLRIHCSIIDNGRVAIYNFYEPETGFDYMFWYEREENGKH